jgi:signal transduction histidine kinase/CheY-like chemotaxis protein
MATVTSATGFARIWLNLSLRRKGAAIVAIPLLCIFSMLGMFGYLQRRAEAADQVVIHTSNVLQQSGAILADSLSLEATARGYLLSREPAFLQLHRESRANLFAAFDLALQLTADNPEQQQHLLHAQTLMREEEAALDSQLALQSSAELTALVQVSRHRIDALRTEIEAFDREERRLLNERQITRLTHRKRVRLTLVGFALLGILAGVFGIKLFTSGVKRRLDRIAENAARYSKRESEGPVDGSPDAIGRLEGTLIGTTRDLLDREDRLSEAAVELERAKTAAEAAAQAKTEFVATISHEIRSPMNALLGAAEMLQATELTETQAEYVGLLNGAGTNLLATVNEVLDHAKIEAGQLELDIIPFDCAAAVDRVAQLLSVSASEKGLDLLAKYTPETPRYVVGDPERLQRVLINLVSNAIKFTESGVVAIRVEPGEGASMLHFAVADTGIGIPKDRQDAIFEKFVQAGTSTRRTYGGTGLGLAICKHIVELMGGRIWVESEAGEGSTFHFTASMPRAAEAPASPAPVRATVKANGFTPAKHLGARILLAEDAATNVALIKAYLSGTNCSLEVATDGIAALERLKSRRYNLALMDVQMPGLDGYEVTRRFREWEHANGRPRTPILSVTAHAFQEDIEAAIKSGADGRLTKPFRRDALIDAIELYQRPDDTSEIRVTVPEFIRELAPEFLRRQRLGMLSVAIALKSGEFDSIQSFAHNMKGCGKSFGFPRLTDLGRDIESAAREHDSAALQAQIEELREYLTAVDIES